MNAIRNRKHWVHVQPAGAAQSADTKRLRGERIAERAIDDAISADAGQVKEEK